MNRLGDETLAATEGAMVTRHSQSGFLTAIAYNYPQEVPEALPKTPTVDEADKIVATGSARALAIQLSGLPPLSVFSIETLDASHGNAVAVWEAMGRPDPPNREQTEALRQAAWMTNKEFVRADAQGNLSVSRPLSSWSVLLLDQMSAGAPAVGK
jgi:xylan 1,4-beta-xylosidase